MSLAALELLARKGRRILALDLSEGIEDGPGLAEVIVAQIAVQEAVSKAEASEGELSHRLWDLLRPAGGIAGPVADALDDLLRTMKTTQSAGGYLTWALDLAIDSGRDRGGTVVFLDEIQRLDDWLDHDPVVAELRGRLRDAESDLTFLFAGSEPSLVASLFADDGLLEFDAVQFLLSPIDAQPWREGLRRAFAELGLDITVAAVDRILEASDGEPHRTMLAANRTAEFAEFAELAEADQAVADSGIEAAKRDRLWDAGR